MRPSLLSPPRQDRAATEIPVEPVPQAADRSGAHSADVKLSYLPSLDGLRAVAVMAVLIYHAEIGWLSGGFLGVEVFFVISGYLITSLLLAEQRRADRVDLRGFWTRRARRLLPALYLLLFAVSAWWLIFLRGEVAQVRGDVVAALTYVTNWWLVFSKQSYFAQAGRPSPFRHLWSLAVEEQFYLVWPLLFVAAMRFLRGRRSLILAITLAGAALSVGLMHFFYNPAADPSRAYYGTDTRASGLLLGAALAFLVPPWRFKTKTGPQAPLVIDGVGILAMGALAWFFLRVNEFDPFVYLWGFALLDVLTVLIIVVVIHPAGFMWRQLLSLKPVVWIGQRSYGIYLWHWPVFVLTRPNIDISLTGVPLLILRLAITFGLAELSYRFVEQPIRRGAIRRTIAQLKTARAASAEGRTAAPVRTAASAAAGLLLVCGVAGGLALSRKPHSTAPPEFSGASAIRAGTIPPPTSPRHKATTAPVRPHLTVPTTSATTPSVPTHGAPSSAATVAPTTSPSTAPTTTPSTAPVTQPVTAPGANVTAIGDSVMLGSRFALQARMPGIYVNAAVSRQWYSAPGIVAGLGQAGYLRQIVVVHLGTNGSVTDGGLDKLLDEVGPSRRVLLVNTHVDRPWEQLVNQRLAEAASSHPNVRLVDWFHASSGHPEYFVHDGVHLTKDGGHAYANLIAQAVR